MTPMTLVPALFVWQWPSWGELAFLAGIGTLASLGHLCFVKAYSIADISYAEPIVFTRLVFAALFGLFVFGEFPDLWVWVGAAIIIAATSYIAHRERAAHDAARNTAAPPRPAA
jgi:drug/metabolite transporter (DMT)-like permease